MRTARDATLAVPALILPSVQVNMRGGQLPDADATGRRYLKSSARRILKERRASVFPAGCLRRADLGC